MPIPGINYYMACQLNDPKTKEPCGIWHFCVVNGDIVYPVGRCRDNNKPGGDPCTHKTEDEARDCYRSWELERIQSGIVSSIEDVLFDDNREYFEIIREQKLNALEESVDELRNPKPKPKPTVLERFMSIIKKRK